MTLLELLVLFSIVSVLVTLVAPYIDITEYRVNGAVREVASTLAAAQQRAVATQHDVVVSFDSDEGWLRIHSDDDNDGEIDPGEAVRYSRLQDGVVFGRGGAPPRPRGGETVSFDAPPGQLPQVIFHRNGSASESGGFYLTSERAVRSANHETDARSVEIERATGRVSWLRYDAGGWRRVF